MTLSYLLKNVLYAVWFEMDEIINGGEKQVKRVWFIIGCWLGK